MMKINDHYMNLASNYLFADIAKKVQAFKAENPEAEVISLGIGDVTQPLCPAVVEALHKAADEMGQSATFRGYGPERGYDFLRNAIVENDYRARGIDIDADEVFVSDGAKSDTGNFQELLSEDCVVAVTDPVYPVYVDSNIMAGRRIVKLPCTAENGFVPAFPQEHVDVIYLCYPNNPTGTTLNKEQLKAWVDYALQHDALIFYDAAYEAFIQSK
ncbi:MAG: aminotransferase class I/II-fold pyridoxal phosphate-dependent enzyme, partial [Bacteroidaceae bacterium]|nr:aminotransferase class I/II-fold pyridoxal phosphate-dependent enzyme [Bacteroidaceae bacterium]